jgi:hypothetical protein
MCSARRPMLLPMLVATVIITEAMSAYNVTIAIVKL